MIFFFINYNFVIEIKYLELLRMKKIDGFIIIFCVNDWNCIIVY